MSSPRPVATLVSLGLALAVSAARADDTAAPEITHTPLEKAEKGKPVHIRAKITDESKFFPQVFYRWDGAAFGKPVDMKKVTAKKAPKDQYQATIPGKGDSLEYYIEAYDEFGNGPARAGAPEAPFKVEMTEPAVTEAQPPKAKDEAKSEEPPAVADTSKTDEPPPTVETRPVPPAAPPRTTVPRTATTTGVSAEAPQQRTWTWVAGGTGAGLLVGGLLTGLGVKKADDAYAARLAQDRQTNTPTLQQQYDANKTLGTTATIMTIGGVVLLGAGTVLYFYEPQWLGGGRRADNDAKEEGKLRFAAAPTDGGAAAVVAGKF
jgi:hypothetical protein